MYKLLATEPLEISLEVVQLLILRKTFQKSLKNCFQGPEGGQQRQANWLSLVKMWIFISNSFYYFFLALKLKRMDQDLFNYCLIVFVLLHLLIKQIIFNFCYLNIYKLISPEGFRLLVDFIVEILLWRVFVFFKNHLIIVLSFQDLYKFGYFILSIVQFGLVVSFMNFLG